MSIASEITNYANGLSDAYDAVNDMQGIIPTDKNMNNLDTAIRTIPQSQGSTYTAGNGINIDANNEISIDDTVVAEVSDLPADFTGATSSTAGANGLVPAPSAGDQSKVLKGDGTWGDVQPGMTTYFLADSLSNCPYPRPSGSYFQIYKDEALTTAVTSDEFNEAVTSGTVQLVYSVSGSGTDYYKVGYAFDNLDGYQVWDEMIYSVFQESTKTVYQIEDLQQGRFGIDNKYEVQEKLVAGSNISISSDGKTISATDTTYSDFIGATSSVAGTNGLVPAPTTADVDKVLKGDGTWGEINGGEVYYVTPGEFATGNHSCYIYHDSALTQKVTTAEFSEAALEGGIKIIDSNIVYTVTSFVDNDGTNFDPANNDLFFTVRGVLSNEELEIWINAGSTDSYQITQWKPVYRAFSGATSQQAGSSGLVPAPAAGDEGKALHGDGTWKDTTAKLVEMSYGESNSWAKFIAAYNAGSIVYCRASSNSNPATGSQTRKAFMAYVNNATSPTSVEFQYVRSQSSKTDSQQTDQVFVYTLTNASGGTWSVASRNMGPKINVNGPITKAFTSGANATITIGADTMTGATSSTAGAAGVVPAPASGDDGKYLRGDGTWQPTAVLGYVDSNFFRPGQSGQEIYKTTSLSGTSYTASEISNYLAAGTQFIIAEVYSGVVISTAPVLYFGDDGVGGYGEICYIREGMVLTTKAIVNNHEWETV